MRKLTSYATATNRRVAPQGRALAAPKCSGAAFPCLLSAMHPCTQFLLEQLQLQPSQGASVPSH